MCSAPHPQIFFPEGQNLIITVLFIPSSRVLAMHRSVALSTDTDSWSKIASTMPFPAEAKETPDASEAREVRELKKAKKLPPYEYTSLKNAALRLLRLGSANDTQLDIDCEIVEIDLPKEGDAPEAAPGRPNGEKKESGEATVEFGDPIELSKLRRVLEKYESKDAEEETPVVGRAGRRGKP
jgi:hypothetical protein